MENEFQFQIFPICRRRSHTHPPPAESCLSSNMLKERDKGHGSCYDILSDRSRNKDFTRTNNNLSDQCSSVKTSIRNNTLLSDKSDEHTEGKFKLKHSRRFRKKQRQQSIILRVMCCCQNIHSSNGNTGPYTTSTPVNPDYSKLSQSSSLGSMYCSSLNTGSSGISSSLSTSCSLLSQDSGYNEPPCYLNILYPEHVCVNHKNCTNKNKASLNIHLRHLSSKMPKSFCESEALPHKLSRCSGVKKDPYLSKRRHAICETSEEMKLNFHDALSSFLTIKAMIKYEFL